MENPDSFSNMDLQMEGTHNIHVSSSSERLVHDHEHTRHLNLGLEAEDKIIVLKTRITQGFSQKPQFQEY